MKQSVESNPSPDVLRPQFLVEDFAGKDVFSGRDEAWADFASSRKNAPKAARVLVIDDEHLIADTLARILNLSGFIAHAVYSGEAALAVLPALCPEIVLTDVRMPDKDGIETAIQIREQCPQTRIVLFSGQASTGDVIDKAKHEGHGFELWPKPIHPRELVKRLREL